MFPWAFSGELRFTESKGLLALYLAQDSCTVAQLLLADLVQDPRAEFAAAVNQLLYSNQPLYPASTVVAAARLISGVPGAAQLAGLPEDSRCPQEHFRAVLALGAIVAYTRLEINVGPRETCTLSMQMETGCFQCGADVYSVSEAWLLPGAPYTDSDSRDWVVVDRRGQHVAFAAADTDMRIEAVCTEMPEQTGETTFYHLTFGGVNNVVLPREHVGELSQLMKTACDHAAGPSVARSSLVSLMRIEVADTRVAENNLANLMEDCDVRPVRELTTVASPVDLVSRGLWAARDGESSLLAAEPTTVIGNGLPPPKLLLSAAVAQLPDFMQGTPTETNVYLDMTIY